MIVMGNCHIILRALIIISSAQDDLFSIYFRNPTKLKGPLVPPPPYKSLIISGMIIEEVMVSAHELYDLSSQMGVCELIGNVNLTPHRREQATAIAFDL